MRTRLLAAAALAALALAASGCGAGERLAAAAASERARAGSATTIYFLAPDRSAPLGVRRSLPRTAREALRALLAGPTAAETAQGVTTAIPVGAGLVSFRISGQATALVDLSGLPGSMDGVDRVRVITQITRSLVGLSGIERVRLRHEGRPWGLWLMSGGVADQAYGYDELLGFFYICSAKPGTEAVGGDCFSAFP